MLTDIHKDWIEYCNKSLEPSEPSAVTVERQERYHNWILRKLKENKNYG